MSLKKDASGRRWVQVEVEVPGTPEEVWQAIATGPGVSSWFVPTEVEEREGGAVVSHFGPGMDSIATATAWDPPRRFAAESQDLLDNARKKLVKKRLDLIIANDITEKNSAFGSDTNKVTLIGADGTPENLPVLSKREVADRILDRVVRLFSVKNRPH